MRLLGYLWSAVTVVPGLLLLLLAKLFGAVEYGYWKGPAYFIRLQCRFSDWQARRNWYGTTIGFVVFLYMDTEPELDLHEQRHVYQQMWFGPFHPLIYALSFLYGLVRYRSFYKAYFECVWERDARRASA